MIKIAKPYDKQRHDNWKRCHWDDVKIDPDDTENHCSVSCHVYDNRRAANRALLTLCLFYMITLIIFGILRWSNISNIENTTQTAYGWGGLATLGILFLASYTFVSLLLIRTAFYCSWDPREDSFEANMGELMPLPVVLTLLFGGLGVVFYYVFFGVFHIV